MADETPAPRTSPTDPAAATPAAPPEPVPVEEAGEPLTQRQGENGDAAGGNGDAAGGAAAADEQPDRLAQAVADEERPRLPFPVVGIGGSAGGIEAFIEFFRVMPPDAGMAFVVILHLPPDRESMLADVLSKRTGMAVREVAENLAVEPDRVYVIAPGRTVIIRDGRLHLTEPVEKRGHTRPVDDFFRSLAAEQRERAICVSMSGMGSNGAAGAQAVKAVGGVCIAQDPETARFTQMPQALIDAGLADFVLRPDEMPAVLLRYASHPYTRGTGFEAVAAAVSAAGHERKLFGEILAILRTRTRRDFAGYKRPTVVRRIQRRMGLNHVTDIAEYCRLLRQNPAEALALADDLMIHVTGFFRDAPAWEALRRRVIVPLVEGREPEAGIRAWVTACSSGEEAYTLAILLLEAAEAAGKPLDIKVFATDMAERALNTARSGAFPLGIEGEVPPERLDRYFQREETAYRVKPEVRELVVFAPQNVLQDPPFSRLDVVTCRNLMIYLEPPMQERVLRLVHFGLREGGALFLGTSETVGNLNDLYEPVDTKWRIYRRTGGAGRPGMVTFPMMPARLAVPGEAVPAAPPGDDPAAAARGGVVRPSLALMTQRALLDRFTPAAVVIDRDHRVIYYHGRTDRFLNQPAGEPTRDVLLLGREDVRGALRAAIQRATADNATATVPDGLAETPNGRVRTFVTAAPLDARLAPGYFLVSFEERPEPYAAQDPAVGDLDERRQHVLTSELRRVHEELQSTIEELQTSNEEMKASNEEVTSINEELQSANEELETSKEELQSLNEEMATVNTQLQAKAEELEATTSDLTSLLASADVGVLFLDTNLRIRRYTPAVGDLLDMIPADLGRPLKDLALKFEDPDLLADARRVLDKLVPQERDVRSQSGRWYLRRVLPYRTLGRRIDGVVVTFSDVTRVRQAERTLRESEDEYRLVFDSVQEYAIFTTDLDGRVRTWSPGAERILGFKEDEAVGQSAAIIFTPEDRAAGEHEKERLTAIETGRAVDERWHVRRDGTRFWASGIMSALREPETGRLRGLVKVLRDNTAMKQAQDALRAGEERLRLVVDSAGDFAMILFDPDGRVIDWNAGAERVVGFTRAEAIGRHGSILFVPEDLAAGVPEQEMRQAQETGTADDERWHQHKDGTRFWGTGVMSALRNSDGSLRGFVKVMRDDTARKGAEDTLHAAKAAAELANRMKDEFLATLSHELRTPLSAILIWAKLLRRPGEPPEFAEGMDAITRSAEAQKQLIDDLLDTSRITSGKLRLEMRPTELAPLVGQGVESVLPTAEAKGVTVAADLGANVGVVRADPDRLRQVVWNLLTNAVKFTPEGGRVDVGVWRRGKEVEIRVADTGGGIDPAFLPHVFEPFRQAESSTTRAFGGLGLGLAICKQLVEQHGGTIAADSGGLGRGATFTVRLPLPAVRPGPRAQPGAAAAPPPSGDGLGGVRVLLVEDDPETRNALRTMLRQVGAGVTAVESAAAAADAFRQARPDLLVSDIGMPGEDGYSLIRRLHTLEAETGADPVPAVALTAFARDEDRDKALAAGFDRHVGKPVEPEQLLATLRELVPGR